MSLWGSIDQANNAPKSAIVGGLGVAANGQALFGNTAVSAVVSGMAVGDFGVSAVEAGVAGEGKKVAHAGWNLRKQGTGGILSITANSGAYGANSFVSFSAGGTANVAANATVAVNGNGSIRAIIINNPGQYANTPIALPASGNAAFTVVMGGRANRTSYETLVAMGSMSGDAENVIFPNS
jgi:hypothetical protein